MRKLRDALVVALAASCAGPQHAGPSSPPAPRIQIVRYAPLTAGSAANVPGHAVILGSDATGGSTVLELPAPAPVTIRAMDAAGTAIELDATPVPGSGSIVTSGALAGPAGEDAARRAAAVVAATLDKDTADYAFTARAASDPAPGASALLAAGWLAAITGAPVDPQATLAGTLAPDGAVLPSKGLADQVSAAIARGARQIGYPAGARHVHDGRGQEVDLEELARAHGATAVAIADVHDAYRLLTGRALPASVPLAQAELAQEPATNAAFEAGYRRIEQQLAVPWAALVQLDTAGRLPQMLDGLRAAAHDSERAAAELHRRGLIPAAYTRLLATWCYAMATTETYDILTKVRAGDLAGARAALQQLASTGPASADVLHELGAQPPSSIGGALARVAAFRSALEGWAFGDLAQRREAAVLDELDALAKKPAAELGSPAIADQVVAAVVPVAVGEARRAAGGTLARDEAALVPAGDLPYTAALPALASTSASLQAAAQAGIAAIDARLIAPAVKSGISEADARGELVMAQPDYFVALLTSHVSELGGVVAELRTSWGEASPAWQLCQLAAAELAYLDVTQLLVQNGAFFAIAGKPELVTPHDAVASAFATSERLARARAHQALVATGAVPVQARLAYQLAQVEHAGTDAEQLDALSELWTASAFSELAVTLVRDGAASRPAGPPGGATARSTPAR